MKKNFVALLLAFTMILSLAACGSPNANQTQNPNAGTTDAPQNDGKTITLTLGHTNNTEHHYQTLSESFKKIVEEKTNGQVQIQIYPAEQLGSGVEQMEAVKTGTQDLCLNPDAYLANYDPIFNTIGMPYVFENWEAVKAFPNTESAKTLEEYAKGQGMVILGWAANGFRVTTSKTEINSPADFSGLKIRVGSAKLISDMLTALNASPTTLSMGDTYNGIQTGIVDGQENPTSNIIGSKFYEVQPYLAVTHHQYVSEPLIMNKAKFDSLPADIQQILLDAGKEVCAADVETCANAEEADLAFIESNNVTITYPDLKPFMEAMEPVTQSYCEQYGEEFTTLLNNIKAGK